MFMVQSTSSTDGWNKDLSCVTRKGVFEHMRNVQAQISLRIYYFDKDLQHSPYRLLNVKDCEMRRLIHAQPDLNLCISHMLVKIKEEGKDQESIQSSTTPDPEHIPFSHDAVHLIINVTVSSFLVHILCPFYSLATFQI